MFIGTAHPPLWGGLLAHTWLYDFFNHSFVLFADIIERIRSIDPVRFKL